MDPNEMTGGAGAVDESGAPWPYEPVPERVELAVEPRWTCPGGDCVCHPPSGDPNLRRHAIVLFDEAGVRVSGARCRVLDNGKMINLDSPYADAAGMVAVTVAAEAAYLTLEWVPATLPRGPRYPFRKIYHLDLGAAGATAVERRLHNLGFASQDQLDDNIRDFQRTYGFRQTGRVEDVDGLLGTFHDASLLPPVPPKPNAVKSTGAGAGPGSSDAARQSGTVSNLLGDDGTTHRLDEGGKKDDPGGGGLPPPGGNAPGGKQPQGSVTAIQSTKIRIELIRAFSLTKDDFDQHDDVVWPAPPEPEKKDKDKEDEDKDKKQKEDKPPKHQRHEYDAHALLRELYPTQRSRVFRLGAQRVSGATVDVGEPGFPALASDKTNNVGVVVFDLPVARPSGQVLAFTVTPPDGQRNESGLSAGPGMTDEHTSAPFLYRPFTLLLTLDSNGVPDPAQTVIVPNDRPRFAKVIDYTTTGKANTVRIDWRPDWMKPNGRTKPVAARWLDKEEAKGKKKKDEPPPAPSPTGLSPVDANVDPYAKDHTPINPFDHSIDRDERQRRAPPGIAIHQTGSHNMTAISGHLAASGVGSHYWVDYDGFVVKMVDEHYKTNHAGASVWCQRASVNQFAVGIEQMHTDTTPLAPTTGQKYSVTPRRFTKEQYQALTRLCHELQASTADGGYPILPRHLFGHMEIKIMAASSKGLNAKSRVANGTLSRERVGCPGDHFEWQRLEEAGIALAPMEFRLLLPSIPRFQEPAVRAAHSDILKHLLNVNGIPRYTKGRETSGGHVLTLKQLLYDIGYSVSLTLVKRSSLSDKFDTPMFEAVRAFQTHHFSGRRRRYNLIGATPEEKKRFPMAGTVDQDTIEMVKNVWWAVQHNP